MKLAMMEDNSDAVAENQVTEPNRSGSGMFSSYFYL